MVFSPIIPDREHLGELKDMAQDIIDASAHIEGRVALETAKVLGNHLRLIKQLLLKFN